jgi:hypothetical protein
MLALKPQTRKSGLRYIIIIVFSPAVARQIGTYGTVTEFVAWKRQSPFWPEPVLLSIPGYHYSR